MEKAFHHDSREHDLISAALRGQLRALIEELWSFDRRSLVIVLALSLVSGLLAGGTIILLVPLLSAAGVESTGSAGNIAEFVKKGLQAVGLTPSVGLVLALWLAATGATLLIARSAMLLHADFNIRLLVHLRKSFHEAIAGARWDFLTEQKNWPLLHAATEDTYRVAGAAGGLIRICSTLLMLTVYLSFCIYISPKVTMLAASTGFVMVFILRGNAQRSYRAGEDLTLMARELFGGLGDFLEGFKVARCYGLEAAYLERVDNAVEEVGRLRYETVRFQVRGAIGFGLGNSVVIALLTYIILTRLELSTASLLLLIYIFTKMMPRFSGLEQSIQYVAKNIPGYISFSDLRERCRAASMEIPPESSNIVLSDTLELRDLTYRYPQGGGVEGVSVKIRMGETVGLVGRSGAGKSTLTDLVVGLFQPQSGEVVVDDVALEPTTQNAWRTQVSYVTQDDFFFNDTLRANLLWARPEASEQELRESLETVQAWALIERLEQGLETPLGEGGKRLSRGERQKLALARALLRQPRLLVLDEATNSLDLENERDLLEALAADAQERITLIVTHRPSTLAHVDRVLYLKDGSLQEQGSLEELLVKGGPIQQLLQPWSG